MADPAIRIRGLWKRYGSVEAVRGVDAEVAAGEVFALLGPNGAGKTTIVEILEGHRHATAGEVRVLGHDPARGERAYRERIGIVLQSTGVEEYLTVRETVSLVAGYYPRPRDVDEVIGLAGLAEQAHRRVRTLSGGQRRRIDLAVALAGDPELLFLDEPTTGFDPSARRQAWELLRGLTHLGKTIFLTTHFMDEAQLLADRVAVIARGEIVAEGSPATLGGRHRDTTTIRFALAGDAELPDGFGAERSGDHYLLRTDDPTRLLHDLTEWALAARVGLEGLEVTRPSLEDVYLRLTAGEVEEPRAGTDDDR